MEVKINFLGTASHIPTPKRNHTGILFSFGSENILIDCGEGIQRQFKLAKLNPSKITRILITHWHGDHTLGLLGLLQTLAMLDYSKTLYIYGPKGTKNKFDLFEKIYGKLKLKTEIHEISETKKFLDEKEFYLEASLMQHKIPCLAYALTIKDKLRLDKNKIKKLKIPNSSLLGKLQKGEDILHPKTNKKIKAKTISYLQKGKKITTVMDTALNNNIIRLAKLSDLLISESSFLSEDEEKAKEYKHLTSEHAAIIAKKAKVQKLVLTHLSHRYDNRLQEVLKEAKKTFKNTSIAKDFDKITV